MEKKITINDKAYDALFKRKRSPKDSFSKVILRVTGEKNSVRDVAVAWKDKPQRECDDIVKNSRTTFDAWNTTSESGIDD
jgi:predicted CopG family antitoxin